MSPSELDEALEQEKQKFFCAIGRVAVEWSRLEGYLRETVRMLAGVDNEFGERIVSSKWDARETLHLIASLSNLRSPGSADSSQFREKLKELRALAGQSAEVLHGTWTFDPGRVCIWRSDDFESRPVTVSVDRIQALAQKIENASWDLLQFRRDFLISLNLWKGQ